MTMREKIALRFEKRMRGCGWDTYLALADDALAALEEPTEGMIRAGWDVGFVPGNVWRAMIAAAKEG